MRMLSLPIARRELLVLSRAKATWRGRVGTSLMVSIFAVIFAMTYRFFGQAALAQAMQMLGAALSMMCLFMGVSLTADSIAEEKRLGTLGLLLLTNLSPFEIVLGKLVAQTVVGFYTVMCALPLLSMSMIFGGMRFTDVLLSVISALNLLFFSAAVGLVASSVCRQKRSANTLGTLTVLFFWQGFPILALFLRSLGGPQPLIDAIAHLSVNFASPFIVPVARLLPATSTWWNLAWPHLLGWAFIALAVWWLPRGWHDDPPRKRRTLREGWKAFCYGNSAARLKLRRKLLDPNPFLWLASRDRIQIIGIWMISFFVMAIVAATLFRGSFEPIIPIGMGLILVFLLQLAFGQAATSQLLREYEQGTLEMILSTPLSAREVAHGQIAAAFRQHRSACATAFLLLWAGIILLAWQTPPGWWLWLIILIAYSGLFLLQLPAIGWLSIWSVVKAPEPKKAVSAGFFMISMLPALICGVIAASVNFLCWLAGTGFPLGPHLLVPLLLILAFGNSVYWLRRAKREVPQELRLFAFRRYMPHEPVTFFGKLGKLLGRCFAALLPRKKPL